MSTPDTDFGPEDELDLPIAETPEADTPIEEPQEGQETEAPEGVEEAVEVKPSREAKRVQTLVSRAKAEADRAAKLEIELALERGRREILDRQLAPREDPQAEAQRLAEMAPEDRMQYTLNKAEQKFEHQAMLMRFEMADKADKADFTMSAASDPRVAKYASLVESKLTELRRAGQNLPRAELLKYIIGEAVMQAKPKVSAQAAKAKDNLERQKAAPAAAKGDQKGGTKPSNRDALRKRLENVPI